MDSANWEGNSRVLCQALLHMEGVPDMDLLERKRAIMSAFSLATVLSVGLVKNKEITQCSLEIRQCEAADDGCDRHIGKMWCNGNGEHCHLIIGDMITAPCEQR